MHVYVGNVIVGLDVNVGLDLTWPNDHDSALPE